jgi:hypothetical protein
MARHHAKADPLPWSWVQARAKRAMAPYGGSGGGPVASDHLPSRSQGPPDEPSPGLAGGGVEPSEPSPTVAQVA